MNSGGSGANISEALNCELLCIDKISFELLLFTFAAVISSFWLRAGFFSKYQILALNNMKLFFILTKILSVTGETKPIRLEIFCKLRISTLRVSNQSLLQKFQPLAWSLLCYATATELPRECHLEG